MPSIQFITVKKRGKRSQDTFINVPSTDEIVEMSKPTDGSKPRLINRLIRYVPGETSIYVDEQREGSKPGNIIFQGSMHFVNENSANKLEYLRKCNYNISNEKRREDVNPIIKEYDRAAVYQKGLDERELIIKAQAKVQSMDVDELKALLLLTADNPAFVSELERMSVQEIQHNAYNIAAKTPMKFLKDITDVKSKDKLILMRAITQNIITHSPQANSLSWQGGNEILRMDHGFNIIEMFVEKVRIDPSYSDVMDMIKAKMKIPVASAAAVEVVSEKPDMYLSLVDDAVKAGIIEREGSVYKYAGKKHTGLKNFKVAMKEDSRKLFTEILMELEDFKDDSEETE